MITTLMLNDTPITVSEYKEEEVSDKKTGNLLHQISFVFQVKSEDYHKITTLLYKNAFDVKVPERNLEFRATIGNYSTSFTNLYKENQVGEFTLELVESVQ